MVTASYLDRIGFEGEPRVSLETLREIQFRHSCTFPFEHIDVLDRKGICLDPQVIFTKMVHQGRGGYCFEQNGLLLAMLREIGFNASPLAARVRLRVTRDELPRRTHMFLRVKLDGESWLCDSGLGGFSLTAPIRWEVGTLQPTPHGVYRLEQEGDRWFHQALSGESWQDLYEFNGEEMPPIDQEVANWYTSTNPTSQFSTALSVGLARPDGTRYAILNDRFLIRRGSTVLETQVIESVDELRQVLAERFGLLLPVSTSFGNWPFTSN